ncbi:MAG TPA: esterase-like activity of phytase family protein [Pyrinomonadaceae bacterium]|nr:esterase-like activity of phytase family protein [Pyrinomonadaceae bacterium]
MCEILAINDHEFLVVERDNRSNLQSPPQAPTRKNIYKIDLTGATEVSGIESLPAGALPLGITTVSKQLFINLLDADLNLAATIPEKIEGLTWGPDLARNSALRVRDRSIAIRFPTAISSRPTLSTRAGEEVTALN